MCRHLPDEDAELQPHQLTVLVLKICRIAYLLWGHLPPRYLKIDFDFFFFFFTVCTVPCLQKFMVILVIHRGQQVQLHLQDQEELVAGLMRL